MIVNLFFLCYSLSFATAKHFATSTREIVQLLQMEDDLLNHMNQYAEGLQRKVNILNIVLAEAKIRRLQANGDPTRFLNNPVTSLSLFRRMYEDVPKLVDFLKLEVATDSLTALTDFNLNAINEAELKEAANKVLLIQNTHDLNEEDVAKGLLHHKQYDAKLSSLDCLALGKHLWENLKQGHVAFKWLIIALKRYDENLKPLDLFLNSGRNHIIEELGKVHLPASKIDHMEL